MNIWLHLLKAPMTSVHISFTTHITILKVRTWDDGQRGGGRLRSCLRRLKAVKEGRYSRNGAVMVAVFTWCEPLRRTRRE